MTMPEATISGTPEITQQKVRNIYAGTSQHDSRFFRPAHRNHLLDVSMGVTQWEKRFIWALTARPGR